jgi:1,4-dihydroxy-2-naphthoate octaprenyltransferase
VAYLVPPVLWLSGLAAWTASLPSLTIPLAVPLVRTVWQDGDPRRLNPVLGATAQLQLLVSVLFAIGLAAGRWVGAS